MMMRRAIGQIVDYKHLGRSDGNAREADNDESDGFCESDYEIEENDKEYFHGDDKAVEWDKCGNMADVEGLSNGASADKFSSCEGSSNEDKTHGKNKIKHRSFNHKANMMSPTFKLQLEFKTHEMFRDVKQYAIKHGRALEFVRNNKIKIAAK
ncbi:hypothetical protein Dimus_024068 [Dionaea muscipula]